MYQSYFMNSPIKDGKCEYQWDTINTNEKWTTQTLKSSHFTMNTKE
jgi:hypothetical protein